MNLKLLAKNLNSLSPEEEQQIIDDLARAYQKLEEPERRRLVDRVAALVQKKISQQSE